MPLWTRPTPSPKPRLLALGLALLAGPAQAGVQPIPPKLNAVAAPAGAGPTTSAIPSAAAGPSSGTGIRLAAETGATVPAPMATPAAILSPSMGAPAATVAAPSTAATPPLTALLATLRARYAAQERPTVVLELDGLLFDSRPRSLLILQEYASQVLANSRPAASLRLLALRLDGLGADVGETLRRLGIVEEAIIYAATAYVAEREHSDAYLRYDVPVAGAVAWVRQLYGTGARLIYVSSRSMQLQLLGTVAALRDAGFPIGLQATELILRPTSASDETVFRQQLFNYLRRHDQVLATAAATAAAASTWQRAFPAATALVLLPSQAHAAACALNPALQPLEQLAAVP